MRYLKAPIFTIWLTGLAGIIFAANLQADNLVDVYELAKKNDPQLKSARATLESARETTKQTDANFLPSIDASANTTYTDTDTPSTTTTDDTVTSYSLSLSVPIYNFSNFVFSDQNESFVAQSEANFKKAELDLMVRVADRYFNVLAAFDNLEFSQAEKEAIGRQLEQTKQRFDVGLVAITDVHEAQARFDSALAESIASESGLDSALESLREITGAYPAELNGVRDNAPLITPEPNDIDEWTQMALKQNLDIIAIEHAVQQARENIKAQRAGYYPTVNANASFADSTADGTSSTTTAGISVNWNLWAGGRTSSQVRQANHDLTTSLENLEQTRRAVQRNTRDAFLDVISGISRVRALKQAVISSESALSASEAGFEVGTRTTVDVLLARQNLFNARRNLSQAKYEYITDSLRLKRSAGILAPDDIEKINQWLE